VSAMARPLPIVSPGVCPAPTTTATRSASRPAAGAESVAMLGTFAPAASRCRTGRTIHSELTGNTRFELTSDAFTALMTSANDPDQAMHDDEFERGLLHDIGTVMSRRRMLFAVGGAGLGALALVA